MSATELTETLNWRGRDVRWGSAGSGPAVVFCHGTPWSSWLWAPFAEALSRWFTVYLWDMPGYGASSKHAEHDVSLAVQGEVLTELVRHWRLDRPHLVTHDFGGATALRAHLLHGLEVSSLALVDVVALRPWGSPFFGLVQESADVLTRLPADIHRGALAEYVQTAAHRPLATWHLDALITPWLGEIGQAAFYRQIVQADERYTDEIETLYPEIAVPTQVVWGADDAWIPVDRAHRLVEMIPGAELTVIPDAGHLGHLDQPAALATCITEWLLRQSQA